MSRRTLVNLAFFAVIGVVMVVWAVNNIVTFDSLERPYTLSAEFEAASGIKPNAEVAYLGVHYGRVTNVERMTGGVTMTMKIDRGKEIPAGSTAHIFRKSAIGEPYIDLSPPAGYDGKGTDFIESGEVIPKERTAVPLEFSELLRSASALIQGIDAEKAGTLIHELALALDGRGDDLKALTVASDQLAAEFAAKTDVLDRLAGNATIVTKAVADHRQSLGQSLTNLRLLADTLRDANGDTRVLLERGAPLIAGVADLVGDQKANLDCLLSDLTSVMEVAGTDARVAGVEHFLNDGPAGFDRLWRTRDVEADGVWVRVNIGVHLEDPAIQYNPPRDVPAVPEVPACTSSLPASGAAAPDLSVAALRDNSSRSLPATGFAALGWLAALLAAAGLATRSLSKVRHGR